MAPEDLFYVATPPAHELVVMGSSTTFPTFWCDGVEVDEETFRSLAWPDQSQDLHE